MAEINERLNHPDNIEVIRDQIGAILSTEFTNQYNLAVEDGDTSAKDYNAKILIENDEPFGQIDEEEIFPVVVISLKDVRVDSKMSVNSTKRKATFNLDCYQVGNFNGKFAGRNAMIKVWKLARIVRKILESDQYTYLFLRGIVSQTSIVSMTSGKANDDASMKIAAVQFVFEVEFDENAPQTTGQNLQILPVQISDENGQVVVNIREEDA